MKTDRSQVSAGVTGKLKRHVGSEPGSGAAGWCKPRCHPTPNRGFVWQPVKFTADTRTTLQRQWHSRRKEWGCGKGAWWSRACARQKQNRERSHQKGALGGSIFACPSFRFHQAPAKAKHGQSSTRARSTKEERGKQKSCRRKLTCTTTKTVLPKSRTLPIDFDKITVVFFAVIWQRIQKDMIHGTLWHVCGWCSYGAA